MRTSAVKLCPGINIHRLWLDDTAPEQISNDGKMEVKEKQVVQEDRSEQPFPRLEGSCRQHGLDTLPVFSE